MAVMQHAEDSVENKPASLVFVFLRKALYGMHPTLRGRAKQSIRRCSPVQLKTSKRSISSLVVCFYLSCILFSTIAQMKKKKTITKKLDSLPISNAVQSSRLIIFVALLFI